MDVTDEQQQQLSKPTRLSKSNGIESSMTGARGVEVGDGIRCSRRWTGDPGTDAGVSRAPLNAGEEGITHKSSTTHPRQHDNKSKGVVEEMLRVVVVGIAFPVGGGC
jgi:hypothetical protein